MLAIDQAVAPEPPPEGTILTFVEGYNELMPGWYVGTSIDFETGEVTGAYTGIVEVFSTAFEVTLFDFYPLDRPDNEWVVSGDNMYFVPTGNVGIGTTSPAEKLEVSGNVKISGFGNGLIFPDGTRQITAGAGKGGGDGGWMVSGNNMYSIPSGNVGIGTTSPSEKLDVAGAANLNKGISTGIALRVNGAEALWYNGDYFSWGFGGTANFFADSVGIGQVDPGPHKLYVNGTGYATGGFWASDLRFKKNIKTIDSPIDKINNIRGVSFEWKRSEYQDKGLPEGEHYGVIAQEIEQVLPEIVKEGPNGDKAVSYTELVPILTEAIKEQQKQLEEQQIQVAYLFQRIEWLERIVQQQFAAAR